MQRNVWILIILFTFMLFPIRADAGSEKEITNISDLLKIVNAQPKIPYLMETSTTAEYTDGSKLSASSKIFRDPRTGRYDLVYKETGPGRSTKQRYLYLPGSKCPFKPLHYKFDAEYKEIGGCYFLNKAKSITEFPARTDRMKKAVVSSELKHAEANPDCGKHGAFDPGLPDRQIMQSMEDNLYYRWHDGAVIPLNAK